MTVALSDGLKDNVVSLFPWKHILLSSNLIISQTMYIMMHSVHVWHEIKCVWHTSVARCRPMKSPGIVNAPYSTQWGCKCHLLAEQCEALTTKKIRTGGESACYDRRVHSWPTIFQNLSFNLSGFQYTTKTESVARREWVCHRYAWRTCDILVVGG